VNRVALSLSLLLVTAPTALAEGNRSLGLTFSPVGVFAVGAAGGVATGYSANLAWNFERGLSRFSMGGHLASSAMFTEATPFSARFTPVPDSRWRPYVGLGVSLVLAHSGQNALGESAALLRFGGEAMVGVDVAVSGPFFLDLNVRYQAFPFGSGRLPSRQLEIAAAHLGLGVKL
jgi:opacity protein-like surface antigen